jgi:hypothetical protein
MVKGNSSSLGPTEVVEPGVRGKPIMRRHGIVIRWKGRVYSWIVPVPA